MFRSISTLFNQLGREVPVLVNLKPSGAHYMEHFHYAGGVPALMRELRSLLDLNAPTVGGGTIGDVIAKAEEAPGQDVIRTLAAPLKKEGAMAVLHGNLAPRTAVIKQSAASPELMRHTGRAVVFDSVEDMMARIDQPDLDVQADDILVLRNAGPKGAPGMPEAGYLPIPMKLARQGVKDMVRISDARMSGTAFGTIVLHIAPESAVGGPLAIVQTGDRITLDVEARRIDLLIDDAEIESRLAAWHKLPPRETPDPRLRKTVRSICAASRPGLRLRLPSPQRQKLAREINFAPFIPARFAGMSGRLKPSPQGAPGPSHLGTGE